MTYTLTDPNGLPLDATGATTPGVVSLAYVASYIPKGQEQYVAYTTAQATGAALGTITRPDFELGGTATADRHRANTNTLSLLRPPRDLTPP